MNYGKINKPKEYISVKKFGKYLHSTNFIIQYKNDLRDKNLKERNIRLGITASKKIGNAVTRNLIKRRIKNIFHNAINSQKSKYSLFIVIGKKNIVKLDYKSLVYEFNNAFKKINN